MPFDKRNRFEHRRQDADQLFVTTAGKQGDDRPRRIEIIPTAEFIAVVLSANFAGQRVATILDVGYPARGVPVPFKGQDRKQQINVALDAAGAIRTPGPKLRAYVIDDPNAAAMKPSGQTQIEIRPINQDRCVGLARIYRSL